MAENVISSGCTVKIRSIRDRWLPVKSRTERYEDTPLQPFVARLSFFTLRLHIEESALGSVCEGL